MQPKQILDFWFKEIEPSKWFVKDLDFDQLLEEKFGCLLKPAQHCELFDWRKTAQGRLAEIIVLDQFSRNIFRDTPQAFASDPLALALAQEAVISGTDQEISAVERNFLYMPYMHSESLIVHEQAVKLFEQNGIQPSLEFEIKHKVIIEKFGRYPHRNQILGRESTSEEIEFLRQPDSGF
ncbi:DUF924 family protein [Paraglaciecola sp.]|uniref:DUF924 family protein n=1 Tax=Paraglaciecola sp. TaxID=1920173 RepID=UPI003EF4B5DA